MASAPDNTPAAPSTSGAWRTCDLTSSGTSASRRIIVLQWRRAATSLGEGVATVSTVPLQYAANCFPRTSRLTDNVGSISWSHPFALTNSPNLSGAFPNCLARNTRMAFTDSHHVASLWSVNFPSSSWRFQCLFSRCRELHSAHWHFQQLFSGRKNHGRCIDTMCLRKSLRGTPQMSQVAVVPAVLSLVSFSTPALSSTVTTLLSSSVSLTAPAEPSSHTTTLASSRVLFPSSRPPPTDSWLPLSAPEHSAQQPNPGADVSGEPSFVSVTYHAGSPWQPPAIPDALSFHPLTDWGNGFYATSRAISLEISSSATWLFLGMSPTNPPTIPYAPSTELFLGISSWAPSTELFLGISSWAPSTETFLSGLPIAFDQSPSGLVSPPMARLSPHDACSVLVAEADPPDSWLHSPWKVTSRSSTKYRGSSSDDH